MTDINREFTKEECEKISALYPDENDIMKSFQMVIDTFTKVDGGEAFVNLEIVVKQAILDDEKVCPAIVNDRVREAIHHMACVIALANSLSLMERVQNKD